MNKDQIQWLNSLSNAKDDGTIMSVMLRDDLNAVPFEAALKFLVQALMNDKYAMLAENKKMASILKEVNLYHRILA